jgi:hypothetical protein
MNGIASILCLPFRLFATRGYFYDGWRWVEVIEPRILRWVHIDASLQPNDRAGWRRPRQLEGSYG